jgi:cytochrome c-type biogenesis protein CcmH
MKKTYFVPMIVIAFLALIILPAHAQTPAPSNPSDDEVNAIAKQLYCPVCENTPLDVCGTQACEQWRGLIRQKLGEGWSEQQIKDYFVTQYGDRVLASPPAHGINWLIYVVPPLIILVGAFILYRFFLSRKQQSTKISQETETISASQRNKFIKQIEEELSNR